MIRPLAALAALSLALVVAGCGEREDPEPAAQGAERLDVVLDFFPNADHAGLYAAIGNGSFEQAGLQVRPQTPSDMTDVSGFCTMAPMATTFSPRSRASRTSGS